MKKLAKPIWFITAILVFAPSLLLAETKLGYVDAARILEKAPQADMATKRLKEEFAPRESEILALQKKVTEAEDQLRLNADVMTEDARGKLERDTLGNKRELKRLQDVFKEDLGFRRNEEISKIQALVRKIIEQLGKDEKYDLIMYEGIAFASERVDLTDKVLERLKKEMDKKK